MRIGPQFRDFTGSKVKHTQRYHHPTTSYLTELQKPKTRQKFKNHPTQKRQEIPKQTKPTSRWLETGSFDLVASVVCVCWAAGLSAVELGGAWGAWAAGGAGAVHRLGGATAVPLALVGLLHHDNNDPPIFYCPESTHTPPRIPLSTVHYLYAIVLHFVGGC